MSVKGNKNAEKWTEQEAINFIESVYDYIQENKDNYHLGFALIQCGQYPELWAYIGNKFKDSTTVFKAIKKVELTLESRIVNSTMTGAIKSAAMAIFYLKNKHGYKDKTETVIETPDLKNVTPFTFYNPNDKE